MSTMDQVVENHEKAWVEIDLGFSYLYPETNITPEEMMAFHHTLNKMANRNFELRVNGAKYKGYVEAGNVMARVNGQEPKLLLEIQF